METCHSDKPPRLALDAELKAMATRQLSEDWSAERISNWLKLVHD
jgi:IS30 family transposase